ncbi:Transposon Tf2-6 polyprotein [Labeo rohita]|uniref:Gypsy retrotransposon integrase-like protein 1 n=1 Tax=Labeo rohita TaxID=84645 RepID=A0ABQ8M1X9_LABRO|nr:Transposon Tf2-6 polyprotein [Labeo rohita]
MSCYTDGLCGSLYPPPAGALTGVLETTLPIIPCLGLSLPVPGLPVHFPSVGHFRALRGLAHREVLLVMLSILSVLFSDCLLVANRTVYRVCEPLLPAFCRPSRFLWINPFDCRRPRPIAWTLTTRLDLPSPHLSAVKTSPATDPATAGQIASEVSAQASMLSRHQQQLDHLTALTEQLVRAVQGLQIAAPPAVSPPPAASPSPAAPPVTASPDWRFRRNLTVHRQPHLYPTDEGRIAFVCSLLTGKALEWATAVWDLGQPTFPSFAAFLKSFKEVFQPSPESSEAGEQIMALKQGRRTAAEYALDFRTLAAQSGWNDGPLKLHYRKGLQPELQVELACRDEGLSLSQYIDLSIRIDNVMRARKPSRAVTMIPPTSPIPVASPEPMQLGVTKLSAEERERRLKNNLCLYCGQAGHIRATCPTRPPRPPASVSSNKLHLNRCEIPVILCYEDRSVRATALIDSGAAGNFIDADFVKANRLPILSCVSPVAVAALDGRPLGTGRIEHTTGDLTLHTEPHHKETIRFFIITSPRTPLILGYPWLHQHEPSISWSEAIITHWSSRCQPHCSQPTVQPSASPETLKPKSLIPDEYQDLLEAFSTVKATHLPPHRAGDCAIDLVPGAVPSRGRIFPLSQPESEAMNNLGRLFLRKKKDGGLRPCIDYRALNAITVKYRYPLPLVPSALEQLRTAKIYTKLDLRSAYNLIRIREGDEWKTAFSTTSGHYEYRVMPFGLANNSYPEHVQHVRAVLQRLIQHRLYAKQEKCEFHQQSISFLGYIISPEGVAMDETKVSAVRDWPRPKTLKELQRFLGFSNFYRRFIRNFSSVAAPLTSMIKKGDTRLSWSLPAIQAFEELRQRFTTAPILHHPDPNQPFLVEVDASSTGVGAVLSQRQGAPPKTVPCAFFSHKLSPAERNYDVGNRELLAIKLALEEWRHWLEGSLHPFTILTDHRNLEYLRSARVMNHRQARWSLFFTRFHFEITYRPGSQNTKADALSRIHEPDHTVSPPESILPPSVIVAPVAWDLMTEITEGQTQDPPPNDCPENLTYVPLNLRTRVLTEVHSTPSSGHPGIEATIQLLHNRFWWPSLRPDVITFIKNCSVCSTSKTPRQLPSGLLQPLPAPRRPWSHIAVDFITDLPNSLGHTTILTVVDRFSKGCRFIPLPKLPTAMETAEALCNSVFRFYGLPEDIVSDRGPQFTSRLWSSFFRLLGVNISLTSGYHPQANGQAERLNQELTRFLRSYCQDHQEDWSRFILWAEYAQNSLRKPSTNLTPFQCVLGYQPPLFPWSGEPSELPAVNSWFQQSEETWNRAHVHLQRAIHRTKTQADRRRRAGPLYEPGQWVWLSTRDLRLRLPCKKLSPRYVGPFKISRQITPVSFRLELPPEYRISPTFHISLLKPAGRPGGAENLEGIVQQGPTPLIIDGEEVYRVNTILDSRRRRGRLQYLVDWEDFGPEEQSWVPAEDILDPSLLTDYHTSHPDRPGPRRRGRPRRRLPPRARRHSQGGGLCYTDGLCGSLYPPPAGALTGVLETTLPIIPCLGLPLPVPGLPVHFPSVGHFRALRGLAHREVLLVMLSILSVLFSDCLLVANRTVYRVCEPLLPAFCRPSRFLWINPFDCRRPRPIAWTLTTRLDLPSPHLSAVVNPSLLFTSEYLIKLLQMDPTPPDSSLTPLHR